MQSIEVVEKTPIGIDLGTTHTVIACYKSHKVSFFDEGGSFLIPSVVAMRDDQVLVGQEAQLDHNAIYSIKRFMNNPSAKSAFNKTVVEIASEILKKAKQIAQSHLNQDIDEAVITVPAYFDETARQATKDAAALAGLKVLRLLNEPTAAALAYGLDQKKEGLYLIYDLGGGTFDVSLLQFRKGVFQVLATGGNTALGGDDIDSIILKKLGLEDTINNRAKAKSVKHDLSKCGRSDSELTIGDLQTLSCSLIQTTLKICNQVLKDANVDVSNLSGIVLVGGSTRLYGLKEAIFKHFGLMPLCDIDPDLCVAHGAAIQAKALTLGNADSLLLDVTPLSLGIETMGGMVEKIIYRNTPIPVQKAQDFTTYQDGQTALKIHVLQGEREMVNDCISLSEFILNGIPPMPAGLARIRVIFALDADGLLTVTAKEINTNIQQTVDIKPTYGLDHEQMKQMIYQAHAHAKEDIKERLLQESIVQAHHLIRVVQHAIDVDKDLLDEELLSLIHHHMDLMQQGIENKDRTLIESAKENLTKSTQSFAEKRLERSITRQLIGDY